MIVAEVPGLDLKSFDISAQGHTLTIHSERKREDEGGDWIGYHRRERAFGEFSRSIQLPEEFEAAHDGRSAARRSLPQNPN
jgi:HSP20 family protein